jgi:hypothetical protein
VGWKGWQAERAVGVRRLDVAHVGRQQVREFTVVRGR